MVEAQVRHVHTRPCSVKAVPRPSIMAADQNTSTPTLPKCKDILTEPFILLVVWNIKAKTVRSRNMSLILLGRTTNSGNAYLASPRFLEWAQQRHESWREGGWQSMLRGSRILVRVEQDED